MRFLAVLWVVLFAHVVHGADPAGLVVSYKDKRVTLDADGLAKLPNLEVEAVSHGEKHRYTGVLLRDVLALVGVPSGNSFKGSAVALVVQVRAADGCVAGFALAEFDPAFSNRTIVLANQQDGTVLPKNAAPFRLVIPEDQRPARWVRQVVSIEIVSVNSLP